MTVGEKFEIVLSRWKDSRKFKMQAECVYVSVQVLRFKITGGQKEMIMEKHLLKKTNQWKIALMNFKMEGNDETVAMSIMQIQDALEYRINPTVQRKWNKP